MTGSGKTGLALFMLKRLVQSPIVIYDTKIEPKFERLKNSRIAHDWAQVMTAADDDTIDYIIFRPSHRDYKPDVLDEFLERHYFDLHNVPAYIDEVYSFHKNGQAGPGLTALLTRGRSKGITTLMSTQRPAWISRFCLSEADKNYIFYLSDIRDKKVLAGVIPKFDKLADPPQFGHWHFAARERKPVLYDKIKLEVGEDTGYSDITVPAPPTNGEEPVKPHNRLIWF